MGQSQSPQKKFFWPIKGEIQLWTYQQHKTVIDSEPISQHNCESFVTNLNRYLLSWFCKNSQIVFTALKLEDGKKIKFIVDQVNGIFIKCENIDQSTLEDELIPQLMWKCWVEIWREQNKKNEITLNILDSIQNAQIDCSNILINKPYIKICRQRNNQTQIVTRQLFYTNDDDQSNSRKYQTHTQLCKAQIWIFNWDSVKQITPEIYLYEFLNKLQSEGLSFYQNTLN